MENMSHVEFENFCRQQRIDSAGAHVVANAEPPAPGTEPQGLASDMTTPTSSQRGPACNLFLGERIKVNKSVLQAALVDKLFGLPTVALRRWPQAIASRHKPTLCPPIHAQHASKFSFRTRQFDVSAEYRRPFDSFRLAEHF